MILHYFLLISCYSVVFTPSIYTYAFCLLTFTTFFLHAWVTGRCVLSVWESSAVGSDVTLEGDTVPEKIPQGCVFRRFVVGICLSYGIPLALASVSASAFR